MRPKTRATIEDLSKVEGKAELVTGEIVEMPPSGEDPSYGRRRDICEFAGICPAYRAGAGIS